MFVCTVVLCAEVTVLRGMCGGLWCGVLRVVLNRY